MAKEKWIKKWSRGMKVQKGIDYARSISKPFEEFFGKGVNSWFYISRKDSSYLCVKESEFEIFEKFRFVD